VCLCLCGGRWVARVDPAYVILSHFALCIFSGDVNKCMFASCQALDSGHGFVLLNQGAVCMLMLNKGLHFSLDSRIYFSLKLFAH
jgi:hypothetical protein